MSDNQLDKKFKTKTELQKFAEEQFSSLASATSTIAKLTSQIRILEQEVYDLKDKELSSKIITVPVTDEELICRSQIQKLYGKAMDQELTLEETKRLDLIIKNLYLIKNNGKPKTIDGESKKYGEGLSKDELIQLASIEINENEH